MSVQAFDCTPEFIRGFAAESRGSEVVRVGLSGLPHGLDTSIEQCARHALTHPERGNGGVRLLHARKTKYCRAVAHRLGRLPDAAVRDDQLREAEKFDADYSVSRWGAVFKPRLATSNIEACLLRQPRHQLPVHALEPTP